MSNCCSNHSSTSSRQDCPDCESRCKSVGMQTLLHNVRFPDNQRLHDDSYYYCPSADCDTAYFTEAGGRIAKQKLRIQEQIHQGWLCYCFDISEQQYLAALRSGTADAIKNFVIRHTESGTCACEIRNPSGHCCLAKFKNLERQYASS